jgi:hypothetical protein
MLHTCHVVFGNGIKNITDEQIMIGMSLRQQRYACPLPCLPLFRVLHCSSTTALDVVRYRGFVDAHLASWFR